MVGEIVYNLDDVRRFLLLNFEILCQNHFIRCITVKRKTVFTYDWNSIMDIAKEAGYLHQYHMQRQKQCKQLFTPEYVAA